MCTVVTAGTVEVMAGTSDPVWWSSFSPGRSQDNTPSWDQAGYVQTLLNDAIPSDPQMSYLPPDMNDESQLEQAETQIGRQKVVQSCSCIIQN